MTLSEWVAKYGKITGYTIAIITLTVFLVRFDQRSADANKSLMSIENRVDNLSEKVEGLGSLIQDREKYERWRRAFNARLKRVYSANSMEYEEVE